MRMIRFRLLFPMSGLVRWVVCLHSLPGHKYSQLAIHDGDYNILTIQVYFDVILNRRFQCWVVYGTNEHHAVKRAIR